MLSTHSEHSENASNDDDSNDKTNDEDIENLGSSEKHPVYYAAFPFALNSLYKQQFRPLSTA